MTMGKIVTVDGETGRLVPLVVRGAQRRSATSFGDAEEVRITIPGVYQVVDGTPFVALDLEGPRRALQELVPGMVAVKINGKVMMGIDPSKIKRKTERRSGIERRKA